MTAQPSEVPALKAALLAAWARSETLFGLLAEGALMDRPIGLRHPFVFYLGHLPAFMWNQLGGLVGAERFQADFDQLFERGIDPLDEECAEAATITCWPAIEAIDAYRRRVQEWVLEESFDAVGAVDDVLAERWRIHHIALEHELMHHETLLYMLQELGLDRKVQGELPSAVIGAARAASEPIRIPGGRTVLGGDFDAQFGWDNEFPAQSVDVAAFTLDSLPVTVAEYAAYLAETGAARPHNWVEGPDGLCVRSMFALVPIEDVPGWPVQASHAEATAYAAWRGGRLPTEAELQHAAFGTPDGGMRAYPWGEQAPEGGVHGVFDFCQWSPGPVGAHPAGASAFGVQELVGNGWEWTSTPFRPLPGFVAYARTYAGYSADFFDDEHYVVFGGSWATDARLLRRTFRNWYQGHYPYVFSSFRVVTG